MIGSETLECIKLAIDAERIAANENYGDLHSHHEAWAVLQEEVEEVVESAAVFDSVTSDMMINLWEMVKNDCVPETASEYLPLIREKAFELVQEGIQVLAVCKRWEQLIRKEKEKQNE